MKRLIFSFLVISFFVPFFASAQETLTITTYYPSPFGVYRELRSQRIAIGDTYFDASGYPWDDNGTIIGNEIPQDVSLAVEGKVGIGTHDPYDYLEIKKAINDSGVMRTRLIIENPSDGTTDNFAALRLHNYDKNNIQGVGLIHVQNMVDDPENSLSIQLWKNGVNVNQIRMATSGNVAIRGDNAVPQAKLDVDGGVKIGKTGNCSNATAGCGANTKGTMRYCHTPNKQMEYCDGANWTEFGGGADLYTWRSAVLPPQKQGKLIAMTGRFDCYDANDPLVVSWVGTPFSSIHGVYATGEEADHDFFARKNGNAKNSVIIECDSKDWGNFLVIGE